jgi:hypothetical protein
MSNIHPRGAVDREIDAVQQRIDKLIADRWAIANQIQSTTNQSKTGILQGEAAKAIALLVLATTCPTLTFLALFVDCPVVAQECKQDGSSPLPGCKR